ncbi:MAG: arsenite efflux transporter metallochaperone ArsD [Hyphomonadaceae bacterium]|nr:arsenite efflux transporter metallochaperone ArsD [Hyphomonadaceae bacterium]
MAKLSVYDPPMCCSTGVCGPDGDDQLAQFAAALGWVRESGVQVERYDLGHQPGAFATNAFVKELLEKDGMACLPLVLVDGDVFAKGEYPSREAIGARLGIGTTSPAPSNTAPAASACCSSPSAKVAS